MSQCKTRAVYFCSNVGGGVFGELQVAAWRKLGVDAHLHSAVSLSEYWKAKSGLVRRIKLRWDMYCRYPLMLRSLVKKGARSDVYVAVTNPFFAPAIAARAARARGAKVINLVYDLYPDALIAGGGWSENNPACYLARCTTRSALAGCDATVFLGERLRACAEAGYGKPESSVVIAVGTDVSPFSGCEPSVRSRTQTKILYSGHMGRLHDWRTIAVAVTGSVPENIHIEIAADGPGANALKALFRQTPHERFVFGETRQNAAWRTAMLSADVALVTMRPGAEKVVMPSKTYSAMAAGQAVLAVCPQESDLADLVKAHDCGWVVEPGDSVALKAIIEELPQKTEEVLRKRTNAYQAAHNNYSIEATSRQWLKLFAELDER